MELGPGSGNMALISRPSVQEGFEGLDVLDNDLITRILVLLGVDVIDNVQESSSVMSQLGGNGCILFSSEVAGFAPFGPVRF